MPHNESIAARAEHMGYEAIRKMADELGECCRPSPRVEWSDEHYIQMADHFEAAEGNFAARVRWAMERMPEHLQRWSLAFTVSVFPGLVLVLHERMLQRRALAAAEQAGAPPAADGIYPLVAQMLDEMRGLRTAVGEMRGEVADVKRVAAEARQGVAGLQQMIDEAEEPAAEPATPPAAPEGPDRPVIRQDLARYGVPNGNLPLFRQD